MKNYRNHQQIVYDVLTITYESNRSGIKTTSLLTKANLSHSRLEKFVKNLTGAGLVNKIEYDGKNAFVITPKEVYDSLPKKDLDRLDRYREQYRKVVLREGKIQRDENKLIKLKEELKDMKSDLVHSGNTMDYLRNNFSFSVSISPLKPRGKTNLIT